MTLIEALRHEHLEVTDAAAAEIERLEAEVRRVTDFYGKTPMDSFRRIEALEAENAALKLKLDNYENALWKATGDSQEMVNAYLEATSEGVKP
jgi:hypothetical protein